MKFFLVLVLAAACTTDKPPVPSHKPAPPASQPATTMAQGRYFMTPDAPPPRACKVDKDCIADTVTDAGGCCIASPDAWPQTWAWHTWLSSRRMSDVCKNVTCPPLPAPSPPAQCAFDVHCDYGQCVNRCH